MKLIFRLLVISSLSFLFSCSASVTNTVQSDIENKQPLLLTSVAPIFKLSQSLLLNTNIEIENIPDRPRSMSSQPNFFTRQAERYQEQFKKADAVITIGKIWPEDSLFTSAREANIRIINIDASKPWSHVLSGVAVSSSPVTGKVSPYFWTSPSNTIRMLNIIAADLQALFPDQADIILDNLNHEKDFYRNLKANFETEFLSVSDPIVFALADEFTYLTSDLGVFVDDYFVKQDIDWTQQDLHQLTSTLKQFDIKVVLHKWQPSQQIQDAIKDADAELLVLDTMELSTAEYRDIMTSNLNNLLRAF